MGVQSSTPRILKGAFFRFDPESPHGRAITFQYNPVKIYRSLEAPASEYFPTKPPRETISFTLTLDATDDLEKHEQRRNTVESGIYSQLSAIELLLYPYSSENAIMSFLAITKPANAQSQPLTLLVWGNKRIVPVQVTELHINEEMFDPDLNPVRATVEVKMRVLNDSDLPRDHKGYEFWKSYISNKVAMAKVEYRDIPVSDLMAAK